MAVIGIRHDELFTVNDLYRFISLTNDENELPKDLVNNIFYIGNFDGCQRMTDMYKKRALNAVAKVLRAASMRALRDFQKASVWYTTNSSWESLQLTGTSPYF